MAIIESEQQIEEFQLRALRHALKLEGLGIKFNGKSRLSFAKKQLGFKGNRESIINQIEDLLGV
jgi:hypothetical protein|tara:strand:+ start:124 stop:315 length:192 start_codon:yes stop_codon:yes gene_type:complete